eukprot:scaffold148_cov371-Prasinococcus_capsulatus_cf.AAC.3
MVGPKLRTAPPKQVIHYCKHGYKYSKHAVTRLSWPHSPLVASRHTCVRCQRTDQRRLGDSHSTASHSASFVASGGRSKQSRISFW